MSCRTIAARKCRTKPKFKQCNVILTNKKSVLTKIKGSLEEENIQTQYSVLGYRIKLYFHDYKLAIETDKNHYSHKMLTMK